VPLILIPLFVMAFSVAGSANGEALLIGKNEVIAATIAEKPANKVKSDEISAPEESKSEVKDES